MKKLVLALFLTFAFTGIGYGMTTYNTTGCFGGSVTITGRVIDATTGNGIYKVKMSMLASDSYSLCQHATTDINGYYTYSTPMLVPNYYYLRADVRHYNSQEDYAYVYNPSYPYLFTYNFALTPAP